MSVRDPTPDEGEQDRLIFVIVAAVSVPGASRGGCLLTADLACVGLAAKPVLNNPAQMGWFFRYLP